MNLRNPIKMGELPDGKPHDVRYAEDGLVAILRCVNCSLVFCPGTTEAMSCWDVRGALEELMIHHAN